MRKPNHQGGALSPNRSPAQKHHRHPTPTPKRSRNTAELIHKLEAIRFDNGPEFISGAMRAWARRYGIRLAYIRPSKPQQNAYVERFNRTLRHEYLEMNEFRTLDDAWRLAEEWLWTYNNERPNMAIGGITPTMRFKEWKGSRR